MRLVLLGPPGAGKGTLASLIKTKFGVSHFSTGDILREEMKSDSALGKEVKGYVESGALVPDEVVTRLIENRLREKSQNTAGYLLDGFPRTTTQADDLDKILDDIGQPIDCAVYMELGLPVIIERLTGRRICRNCGAIFHVKNKPPKQTGKCDLCSGDLYQRPDDNQETIQKRMDVYLKNTKPIIDYYLAQGKLIKVNSDQETPVLLEEMVQKLDEITKSN